MGEGADLVGRAAVRRKAAGPLFDARSRQRTH
jgi:hypothetical protein